MTDAATEATLLELEYALSGMPEGAISQIVRGVREEVDGLTAAAATARLIELGVPAMIAEGQQAQRDAPPRPAEVPIVYEPPYLARLAAILVLAGGLVVPIFLWVTGIVLMWNSEAWMQRQKLLVTLLPPVAGVVGGVVFGVASGATSMPLVLVAASLAALLAALGSGIWLLRTAGGLR